MTKNRLNNDFTSFVNGAEDSILPESVDVEVAVRQIYRRVREEVGLV